MLRDDYEQNCVNEGKNIDEDFSGHVVHYSLFYLKELFESLCCHPLEKIQPPRDRADILIASRR